VTEWDWDPDQYLREIQEEIPRFAEFQDRAAEATGGIEAYALLELGIGTGETTRRVLNRHSYARLTAIDSSPRMLERARAVFPDADLRLSKLEDPLPEGPFDLVFSALAIHHLDPSGKRDLFGRIHEALRPGGRFVLADVVVPEREEDMQIEIDWVMDLPDSLDDQLEWLRHAGFAAEPVWTFKDLAIVRADRSKAGVPRSRAKAELSRGYAPAATRMKSVANPRNNPSRIPQVMRVFGASARQTFTSSITT
jgi:tRNA (cmo5U34)-methyltransferase